MVTKQKPPLRHLAPKPPALPADEFYVVRDSSTKKCMVVDKKPPTTTTTVVSDNGKTYMTNTQSLES